jgi:hypothetical protein
MGVLKTGEQRNEKIRGGWNRKLQVVSADDKIVVELKISSGRNDESRSAQR